MHAVGASVSGEASRLGEGYKQDVNEEGATKKHPERFDEQRASFCNIFWK